MDVRGDMRGLLGQKIECRVFRDGMTGQSRGKVYKSFRGLSSRSVRMRNKVWQSLDRTTRDSF